MSATTGVAGLLNRGGDWLADLHRRAVGAVNAGGAALPFPVPGDAPPLAPAPPASAEAAPPEATPEPTAAAEPPPQRPHPGPDAGLTQQQRIENAIWENERQQAVQNAIAANPDATSSERDNARTRLTNLTSTHAGLLGQLGTEVQRVQTNKEQTAARERQATLDAEARAAKPPRGSPLPAVRKTYTPPGGTPVSAWVPQIADGNGGSQDDPNGTPTRDTSLVGEALSGGETGAQQRQLDLATAQTKLEVARAELAKATSPEAVARARIEMQTAELALEQARRGLDKPSETTNDGYLVRVAPSGEVTRIDTLTPQQRAQQDEVTRLALEKARQGPTFTDATAAYNAQVPRLQQAARTERDRLLELQRSGAISEADAERQFSTWFGQNVEAPLAGYRTAAEEAQRRERLEQATAQRAEDARAEGLNRQRETVGYQAGEQARAEAMRLAPQGRSPQFLQQYGSAVAGMSARAGARSAEEAGKLPATARFTADTFRPENFAGSVPNMDEVARSATARALAAISPSVARQIGAPLPTLPTGPTLQGMLGQIPYRGPLSGLPTPASGLLPTPGMNQALDIGGGRARTPYGPGGNVWLDWDLPR